MLKSNPDVLEEEKQDALEKYKIQSKINEEIRL